MFKSLSFNAFTPNLSDDDTYRCTVCHENTNHLDYDMIKVYSSVKGHCSIVSLLHDCNSCKKFLLAKGSMSNVEFYESLLNDL